MRELYNDPTTGRCEWREKQPVSKPPVRSERWLSSIVRYFVRRDISKAIDRLRTARMGAALYDVEAVRYLNEAETYLRCARSKMRDNDASSATAGAHGSADSSSRPEIRSCVECGENAPEHGLVCDECRTTALND